MVPLSGLLYRSDLGPCIRPCLKVDDNDGNDDDNYNADDTREGKKRKKPGDKHKTLA